MRASYRPHPRILTKLRQLWRLVRESHAQPLTGSPQVPPAAAPGETAITFIGHSSFLIQTSGRAVLIDPVFATRLILLRRQRRAGVRIADLPDLDAVLLTHAHMDHLNRPSLRAVCREMRRRGRPAPVAVVPRGVADLVRPLGFREVHELDWWQSYTLTGTAAAPQPKSATGARSAAAPQDLTVTHTPAKHWGARLFRDTHRGFGGYVLAGPAGQPTVYHSGDTAAFDGFAEIGRRLHPEVALLPIGAYFPDSYRAVHTSPEEALTAFRALGAATMVPMHYGTFRLGREPMSEPLPRLLAAAEAQGLRHCIAPLGEGLTLTLAAGAVPAPGRASAAGTASVLSALPVVGAVPAHNEQSAIELASV